MWVTFDSLFVLRGVLVSLLRYFRLEALALVRLGSGFVVVAVVVPKLVFGFVFVRVRARVLCREIRFALNCPRSVP